MTNSVSEGFVKTTGEELMIVVMIVAQMMQKDSQPKEERTRPEHKCPPRCTAQTVDVFSFSILCCCLHHPVFQASFATPLLTAPFLGHRDRRSKDNGEDKSHENLYKVIIQNSCSKKQSACIVHSKYSKKKMRPYSPVWPVIGNHQHQTKKHLLTTKYLVHTSSQIQTKTRHP